MERNSIRNYRRIVVKVGTTTITHPNGKLSLRQIERLACVLTDLRNKGLEVVLVSSGAIAAGTDHLGLAARPRDIPGKQAASAVGQGILMQIYESFFMQYSQKIAQILLSKDVLERSDRRQYAMDTLKTLLSMGVIPIVNENDTVAIDELEISDNDTLSAHIANLVQCDGLILLSDIEGLYDSDPKLNPEAKRIDHVESISASIENAAGDSSSDLGTGGMLSKISAANLVIENGIDMIIASGSDPAILYDILEGKNIGTFFKGFKGA